VNRDLPVSIFELKVPGNAKYVQVN
jgi:hypothetical protein